MGRWTAKSESRTTSSVAAEAIGSRLSRTDPKGSCRTSSAKSPEAMVQDLKQSWRDKTSSATTFEPPARSPTTSKEQTADDVAEEALLLLQTSSLSEEQRRRWEKLSAAVSDATPPPEETKRGPPSAEVLAAMQSARKAQDAFIAELSPAQKEEIAQILELKKRERKLRSKEEMTRLKSERESNLEASQQAKAADDELKKKKKEVMERAFWLYQKDRQMKEGTKHVDSTEWKRIRAIGGESATLRQYLQRAGWDKSWPWPEPEGRLLRREGQDAAVAYYSQRSGGR